MEDFGNSIVEEVVDLGDDNITDTTDIEESEPELDLDNLEFEEEYTYNGYDFSKYKDILDDDDSVEMVETITTQMKALNYTQEQADFLADLLRMATEDDEEEEVTSPVNVKEELNKYLTKEEKRNYKAVANFINTSFKGTEMEEYVNEIKSNPFLVKMFHTLYKGKGVQSKVNTTKNISKGSGADMTAEQALGMYREWIENQDSITAQDRMNFVNSIISKAKNKKEIKELFEQMF